MSQNTIVSTPAVQQSETLRSATERVNPWLGEVLKPSPEPVAAEWDRATVGAGDERVVLRLRDFAGGVTGVFAPSDFNDRVRTELRFYMLFSDLLQIRTHRLLQDLSGSRPEDN